MWGVLWGVLSMSVAASGDDCSEAMIVLPGTVVPFDTTTASSSGVEIDPAVCAGTFFTGVGPDVWFRLPLPSSGTLRLSTCDPGGFDTDLSVHTGPCEALTIVACNGDVSSDPDCQRRHSALEVEIASAGDRLVRIGGFNGVTGTGVLVIDFEPACPGDFDGDGRVSGGDLGRVFLEWGECSGCAADLDGDGRVGGSDLGLFFLVWGDCD